MEIIILGSCVALATGISAYSVLRTRTLTEEVTSQTNIIASVSRDVERKAWLQSKGYSEELTQQYNKFTKQINEHDKHLEQLLATVKTNNNTVDSSLSSLKGYVSNTKQELASVIDGKFNRNKQDLETMRDEVNSLRNRLHELDGNTISKRVYSQEVETLYDSIQEVNGELNKRIDALAVTINKVTIDKLAKGEREIYEMLKLGVKQREIAKRLHTTEQRVSAVKKQLMEKGLLEQ